MLACMHNQCLVASFYFPLPAGEMRNDLYITLEKGEFEKGGKSVARNVEITVYVLDIDGQVLKVKTTFSNFAINYSSHCNNLSFLRTKH